jgi:polar amino acid transport system ATP-binding protein
VHALKNVSTQVAEEVVVIVGPSGSGKSTFLRTLNQLETINDGNIVVDGISLTEPGTSTSCGKRWAWCSSLSTCSPT